jgi:hypothetical protein
MPPTKRACLEAGFKVAELIRRNGPHDKSMEKEVGTFFTQAGFRWHQTANVWANFRVLSNMRNSLPMERQYIWNWFWVGLNFAYLPYQKRTLYELNRRFGLDLLETYLNSITKSEREVHEILAFMERVLSTESDNREYYLAQLKSRLLQLAMLEDENNREPQSGNCSLEN